MIEKLKPQLFFILNWGYQRLIGDWNEDGFKKYFKNTSWMFLARAVSLFVSFLTIAIVARYLGPENFGKLSYAQSFIAIFSVFASLGIDQILYRNLAAEPEREQAILGTAFITKLIFGSITLFTSVAVALSIQSDPILTWLIAIIALTYIFQPLGILGLYFQAKVQAKYPALITIILGFLIPALKLLVIYFDQGILYFAAIIALEALFVVVCYVAIYVLLFGGNPLQWSFSRETLTKLLKDSWPLMLAGLSGYIYGRIDQVMIQNFLDSTSVGLLGILPALIISSLVPALVGARVRNREEYVKRLRSLILLCLSISVFSALFLFLLAPWVVSLLFGSAFTASVGLLRIYVWSTIGTVLIILMQQYLIVEHQSKQFLIYSVLGATTNIFLNLQLIPLFGMTGAAYATLITFAVIIFTFLIHNCFEWRYK
jgi:O-antigen/teichoic acid export membrane protein